MARILMVVFICLLFFSSCGSAGGGTEPVLPYDPTNPIEQVDELFVYDGIDTTTISTNNGAYWSSYGYTLWALNNTIPDEDFTERTVTLVKHSGDSVAGYGIVVCHGYRENYGYTMVTVMINAMGRYTIGKVIGAEYESVVAWKNCAHLVEGKGPENTLRLTYDNNAKIYTLFINGIEVETFNITEPVHESGRSGYIVVISPQDSFPDVPVRVSFSE